MAGETPTGPVTAPDDSLTVSGLLTAARSMVPWLRAAVIATLILAFLLLVGVGALLRTAVWSGNRALLGRVAVLGIIVAAFAISVVALFRYEREWSRFLKTASWMDFRRAVVEMRKTWAKAGAVGLTAWLLAAVVIGHRIRVPDYRRALRQAKIRKTVAALEDTSDAIERYARERGRYPQAQSVADLASELEPRFIEHLQRADAWDKPLRYAARCENRWCYDYRLYSEGGRDNAAISEKNLFSLGDMQVRMPGRWPPAYQPSTADQSLPEGVIIYGAGCLLVVPRDARDGPGEMQ